MRRFLAFLGIFLIVLITGYLQPVFFPTEKKQPIAEKESLELSSHTALPYEEIAATGYSKYVGSKTSAFVAEFGEPVEKQQTGMGYELWSYGEADSDYLEVNVQEDKIAAIKTFNNSDKLKPFSMGMSLSDVSELMTIYSNFAFTYKENKYNIELMEEDMNYRPLIAFDNKTFAILFFNHGTGSLTGIIYLNKETLLTLMPYQLVEGAPLLIPTTKQDIRFDAIKSNQVVRTINLLKNKENLSSYYTNTDSQKNAQKLFELFSKNQKTILSLERIEAWEFSMEQMTATDAFTLTNDEYQKLLKIGQLDKKKETGMYTTPVYDATFTVLSWFSDSLYHSRFAHKSKENLGVAFSKASMLVLVQEKEISQTEGSEAE